MPSGWKRKHACMYQKELFFTTGKPCPTEFYWLCEGEGEAEFN